MSRYFTVEFLCDDLSQAQDLCSELQEKYDIALRKERGVRISAWRDGPMVEIEYHHATTKGPVGHKEEA